jgi:NAD(P)-dependent dehydrogenase (short-subunit alcohol dehydrogenase family)
MLLKDRVAIVTGAATGIGKGIALRFAAEGCQVVVVDISAKSGEKTVKEICQNGGDAFFVKCDITDYRQVQDMVNQAIEKYRKIDILVNNAGGVSGDGKIEDVSEENWRKVIDLNLNSQFFCCKAVVPHMKKNGYGKIINVSSMGAIHPPAPIVHYHSAKHGVLGLTTNLALELAHLNITVNAVLPGPILTEFYTEILKTKADPEAFLVQLGKQVPMQRMGTPEDVAGVALFLASDLSAYVTGEAINCGGGLPISPLAADKK